MVRLQAHTKNRYISPKKWFEPIIKYALYCGAVFVLCLARIADLNPLGAAAYAALIYCGVNAFVLGIAYVGAMLYIQPTLQCGIGACIFMALMCAAWIFHRRNRRRISLYILCVYTLVASGAEIYFFISEGEVFAKGLVALCVRLLYMCAAAEIAEAGIKSRFKFKLNEVEYCAMGAVILGFGLALAPIKIGDISIIVAVCALVSLMAAQYLGVGFSVAAAIALATGEALVTFELYFVAVAAIAALAASAFARYSRWLSAIALVLVYIALGYHFNLFLGYGVYEIAAVAGGATLFLLLPHKRLHALYSMFSPPREQNAMRHLVNNEREKLGLRLKELAQAFLQMQGVFGGLAVGGTAEENIQHIAEDTAAKVCEGCKCFGECFGDMRGETYAAFCELAQTALQRGECTPRDLSPYLTQGCIRAQGILSNINQASIAVRARTDSLAKRDASLELAASHMGGIGKMLEGLGTDVAKRVSFDLALERRILEELNFSGIICGEVVVFSEKGSVFQVICSVRANEMDKNVLCATVSATARRKLDLVQIRESGRTGWQLAWLKAVTRFDIVFGCAAAGKNNNATVGDTHSFLNLDSERFMLALLDGMGSGISAFQTSSTAAQLVENLYRAGFDNELALSSANKLLTGINRENYAAADIAVVDLMNGQTDIIKIGAPQSFIKRKNSVEVLSGSALPLGAFEESKPSSTRKLLFSGDMLVLCSDGITDCVDEYALSTLINDTKTVNPQLMAETILKYCYEIDKSLPHDDMTVIVARLYER